jgi:hypothetical protein
MQRGAGGLGDVSLGTFSSPHTVGFRLLVATRTMSLRCFALAASKPKYALATTHEHGNAADKGLRSETELVRIVAENPFLGEGHETFSKRKRS